MFDNSIESQETTTNEIKSFSFEDKIRFPIRLIKTETGIWKKEGFPKNWSKFKKSTYKGEAHFCTITGEKNNITAIDIDTKNGQRGEESFKQIFGLSVEQFSDKYHCYCSKTPNNGWHLLFEYSPDFKTTDFKNGIEIKNDSGHSIIEGKLYKIHSKYLASFPDEMLKKYNIFVNTPKNIETEPTIAKKPKEPFEKIKKLVLGLDTSRANDYNDWVKTGMILKSSGYKEEDVFELFDTFSKQSSKYKRGELKDKWNSFEFDGNLTTSTLFMWLKEDNPDLFETIKSILSHASVAGEFIEYLKTKNVSLVHKNKECFYFWNKENVIYIKDETSRIVKKMFLNQDFYLFLDDKDAVKMIENDSTLNSITSMLKTQLNQDVDFDKNEYLLAFTNGVYDLQRKEFRDARADDLLTKMVDYPYNAGIGSSKAKEFISSLFEDKGIELNLLQALASTLTDAHLFTSFYIFVGNGSNGKSVLCNLHQEALGTYSSTMNADYFTEKNDASSKAQSELFSCITSRCTFCPEASGDDGTSRVFFNSKKLKLLSGGDPTTVRDLNGKTEKFIGKMKIFMCCQTIPAFNDQTVGFSRRLNIFVFSLEFVENPVDGTNQRKNKKITIDEAFKQSYMNLLIEVWASLETLVANAERGIPQCDKVRKFTEEYLQENDDYRSLIENHFELTRKNDDFVDIDDAHSLFRINFNENISKIVFGRNIQKICKTKGIEIKRMRKGGGAKRNYIFGIKNVMTEEEDF